MSHGIDPDIEWLFDLNGKQTYDDAFLPSIDFEPPKSSDNPILCVRCRAVGHQASECRTVKHDFTPMETLYVLASTADDAPLCDSCSPIWPDLTIFMAKRMEFGSYFNLGSAIHRVLRSTCPLCRMVFVCLDGSTIPSTGLEDLDIFLSPRWASEALGSLLSSFDMKGYHGRYLAATFGKLNKYGTIGVLEDPKSPAMCLSAGVSDVDLHIRHLNPIRVDIDIVKGWIDGCAKHHGASCSPTWDDKQRQMRLLDVRTRKIVQYPQDERVAYVALSYVWGSVEQGEDAIHITKDLGMDYLWVDSICIDQADKAYLDQQIQLMDLIYQGATLTLVALKGNNANSGLARVRPREMTYSKMTLPSILSIWVTRGWTLQEALLSPRCLYFADNQAYFECNVAQACELIFNLASRQENHASDGMLKMPLGIGTSKLLIDTSNFAQFMNPFARTSDRQGAVGESNQIEAYSLRSIREDSDAINAISAVLNRLEASHLTSGLVWRRCNFPSWSWAGWKGPIDFVSCEFSQLFCNFYEGVELNRTQEAEHTSFGFNAIDIPSSKEKGTLLTLSTGALYYFDGDEPDYYNYTHCNYYSDEDEGAYSDDYCSEEYGSSEYGSEEDEFMEDESEDESGEPESDEQGEVEEIDGNKFDCLLIGQVEEARYSDQFYFIILEWVEGIAYRKGLLLESCRDSPWDRFGTLNFQTAQCPRIQRFLLG
ncbi:HET-domain-containing protein [Daldinia caldariorum]|uniref:HET-domain-containing protein n=1 Tax=Daldinia caldariorum TaxID=326644 RepID=UPI0020081128|nr:HET-domain-containing protein [Daldinia caldariorum]KAI1470231.1 HET-domain-containing protein [Daldinia caldariorum]